MPDYLGAIDQGTTSTRFIVFDRGGRIVSVAQKEHAQIYPRPGWVEHDPEEIWQRTLETITGAIEAARLGAKDLAAIGITNQRETTVVWNRATGKAVCNAIVWQDTRVQDAVAEFSASGGPDRFRQKTGLPVATYFSALKIRWILAHIPGARELAQSGALLFGNIDSYLVWRLTGGSDGGIHITDVTNASRTQLMDLRTLAWDDELLRTFDIPDSMLPRIVPSSHIYAEAMVAPLAGVPIAGILGDQQAALVGQVCFARGEAKNTYGTGCFLLMNTGEAPVLSKHGLITTVGFRFGDAPASYALEGSIAVTGALVQWLRDNLGIIKSSAEVETLARTVADNGGVYFVPAFSGLFAPYWQADARGVVAGLTQFANKGHLARAALEATAYQTREVLEAMELDSGVRLDVLRADGGMIDDDLLMQFQSDILGREVVRPAMKETTALGAAYAAGLGVGFYKDAAELRENWQADRAWKPVMDEATRTRLYSTWKKAVTRSFHWAE